MKIEKIFLIFTLFLPLLVFAQDTQIIKFETLEELFGAIISFLKKIIIPFSGIMFLIAGYFFVTAGGDPEKINLAKRIIIYTMIGLLFILLAEALVEVIKKWIS